MIDEATIGQTLELMRNRGPDVRGFKHFSNEQGQIYLLHSRLKIIDLDERANQPFHLEGRTLIFNGEIYNYVELRDDLKKKGHKFTTESDTEVLLHAYLEYGEQCVDHFEGMWSFVIYDEKKSILFLSRDRFAEKPLFYLETESGIYFASEIKFIRQLSGLRLTVNKKQLLRYLTNGYKSLYKHGEAFFEEIKEVPYANNMTINNDLQCHLKRYWLPRYAPQEMTLDEAIEGTRRHLFESVRLRLRSDVPLAFCLSGGIDSSALVSIAAKKFRYDVSTFTIIDEDERYNEYANAKATIDDLGCRHTFIRLNFDNVFEKLTDLIRYHDVPIATITYFAHSFLSRAISENGYKVAISGTSADELFTGYYDHFNLHLFEMRDHPGFQTFLSDWEQHVQKLVRNQHLKNSRLYFDNQDFRGHVYDDHDIFRSYLKNDFYDGFVEERFCDSLLRNRMLNELFHEATPVILHEDDLNSMKYSVENRSPYLDSRLFAFAYSIPSELLIKNGYGKYILRQAVEGVLNDKVRLDNQKKGFNASILSIFDFSDPKTREYFLDDGPIFEFVRKENVESLLEMRQVPNSYSKFLFNFINSKIFLEMDN